MDLKWYFRGSPRGSKKAFAEKLGITSTWLGMIIGKKRKPSVALAKAIIKATKNDVTMRDLRPDIFK